MNPKQLEKIKSHVQKYYPAVTVTETDGCVRLTGILPTWNDVVSAGRLAVSPFSVGVLNDLTAEGITAPPMRLPEISDTAYDNLRPDVLVIGGGIIGCTVLRELTRYKLSAVLVEKEDDVAAAASSRNDGMAHVGIDMTRRCKKLDYLLRANHRFEQLSEELDFKFKRRPQYLLFGSRGYRILMPLLARRARRHGIPMEFVPKEEMLRLEPAISPKTRFAERFPTGGTISPYDMTIAYADNAVSNGAQILLNTAVLSMNTENGKIASVVTNRGTIYPRVVVNAAGVWSDKVAEMAGDRFFTIHARRGTSCIIDRGDLLSGSSVTMYGSSRAKGSKKLHTKGGGIMSTLDANIIVGPDAVETHDREDTTTRSSGIATVMAAQRRAMPVLNKNEIITYFTGVRASTYEEDFVLRKGRRVQNIVHAAGIQSPGLTAAPAIADDVSKWAVEILAEQKRAAVVQNPDFNPRRKGVTRLAHLSDEQRTELIKQNPQYGEIVCRCEGISKGEIIDALNLPLKVHTIDALKRRVRSGMGRCQGGFCQPLVLKIIAEMENCAPEQVIKKGGATILTGNSKEK